jgi:hypothetical protein
MIRTFGNGEDSYGFGRRTAYAKESTVDLTIKTLVEHRDGYSGPVT